MTVAQSPIPVRSPIPRHLLAYAMAAVALVASLAVGFSLVDSDPSSTVGGTGRAAVVQDLPSRFGEGRDGSADAIERRALDDAGTRYGSPDAAERGARHAAAGRYGSPDAAEQHDR